MENAQKSSQNHHSSPALSVSEILWLYIWIFSLTDIEDYIIEKEPLVNKFISVPKDKGKIYHDLLHMTLFSMRAIH